MNDNELKNEISKNIMGILIDVLFITQKQVEEWLVTAPEGSRREDEYSDLILGLVRTRKLAEDNGIYGYICKNCKDKQCAICTLEKLLNE